MARVVLAMSGGVDSSVAAVLLQRMGHDVVGVFMRHGLALDPSDSSDGTCREDRTDHKQGCCSATDAADARRVADQLDIPFYALNLSSEFGRIIDYFADEYVQGRTPNPCIVCNQWLKFGKLFEYADSVDAQFVATGHYARLMREEGETTQLRRGVDDGKDQSYVLFGINPARLDRMLLPVGDYCKSDIRHIAGQLQMRVADKRDSQEICFVTSGDHAPFVRQWRPDSDTSGQIITADGTVVGEHDGIEGFTIGQRKGLGVALGEPYYVVRIHADRRQVVIGQRNELACERLSAGDANWLVSTPVEGFSCDVQIRYNSRAVPAWVEPTDAHRFDVRFDQPCFGVAPGQAAVCYVGDRVVGGGWID